MEYKNILIIKMSSLGDILHTLPFAYELRKLYPKAKISWMVHPQFAGFVPDKPVIDEVLYFDKVKFKKIGFFDKIKYFFEIRNLLHSKNFDLVIDMQGLFKSAVIAGISGCNNRIGYCEMREGSALISRPICGEHSKDHVIERYLDVARYLGADIKNIEYPMPDLSEETTSVFGKMHEEGLEGNYIVLVPGARWVTKEWPAEYYAELAKMLINDGFTIVLAGGPDEVSKGNKIKTITDSDKIIDLTGKTTLRELAALIKASTFYISADTGPLHFAAALKKPLVAMYGPTNADRTGPYGNKHAKVILTPAKCAGCLKKQCNDWHCMYDITPQMVYKAYKEVMGGL